MQQTISVEIWNDKYRYGNEANLADTFNRVIDGIYAKDSNTEARDEARVLLHKGLIVPAGRILAGAGTPKRVTLINCFVSPRIQDSMATEPSVPGKGIMDALKDFAITQQMGGGIGMGFGTVRPSGALVKRTGSVSTGVLPFMDMWNAMCGTVKSSGSRRGAMMGTLPIWHPDIIDFITAKRTEGRLKNFNISVLVTDDFMKALADDADWDLWFTVPRADGNHVAILQVPTGDDRIAETRYVYKRIKARELWNLITESTYVHAEPGVIFIDRVNNMNNLYYCETINATNPCGEQPLPPDGDCNLGHVNLAVMVKNPFTAKARFDFDLLEQGGRVMVRLLDNVLDITQFPTEDQRQEAMNKRREGIGYTGLANALQQLGIVYGSPEAVKFTSDVGYVLRNTVYAASIDLSRERGPFPLFDADKYCDAPFIKSLDKPLQESIRAYGVRNALLLSLAPTGTTSILFGNVSSGIEPVFSHSADRKVLQPDGTFKVHDSVYDYGYLKYHEVVGAEVGSIELPRHFVTAKDLTVQGHLAMQAAAQIYVDASISKTINCPTEMTFDEFKGVYTLAYNMGLKGCTTYRFDPRSTRGSVLSEKKPDSAVAETPSVSEMAVPLLPMKSEAEGRRYRIDWPNVDAAVYLNINDGTDSSGMRRPFEIFANSKNVKVQADLAPLTRMVSAIFRRGGDVSFVAKELQEMRSFDGGKFYKERFVGSIYAMIEVKIEEHLKWLGMMAPCHTDIMISPEATDEALTAEPRGEICGRCQAPAVVRESGCRKCMNCGHSECG